MPRCSNHWRVNAWASASRRRFVLMNDLRAGASLRRVDQITSAGEDTGSQHRYMDFDIYTAQGNSRFISIEVFAIARRRSGLCCETKAPIRSPFAQKLMSARSLLHSKAYSLLIPYTTADEITSCHIEKNSPCTRALSKSIPSSRSTSRLSILVNGTASGQSKSQLPPRR